MHAHPSAKPSRGAQDLFLKKHFWSAPEVADQWKQGLGWVWKQPFNTPPKDVWCGGNGSLLT
jgi:hypothetical protein